MRRIGQTIPPIALRACWFVVFGSPGLRAGGHRLSGLRTMKNALACYAEPTRARF
jgi:hypothetical protein